MALAALSRWHAKASACADHSGDIGIPGRPCPGRTSLAQLFFSSAFKPPAAHAERGVPRCPATFCDSAERTRVGKTCEEMCLAMGEDRGWRRMSVAMAMRAQPRRSAVKRLPLIADR